MTIQTNLLQVCYLSNKITINNIKIMDDKTKELIQRALKEGVESFSLNFLEKIGVTYEYVGGDEYMTKKTYYLPEFDYIFSIRT